MLQSEAVVDRDCVRPAVMGVNIVLVVRPRADQLGLLHTTETFGTTMMFPSGNSQDSFLYGSSKRVPLLGEDIRETLCETTAR